MAESLPGSLLLMPDTVLSFRRPFTTQVKETLHLTNPSEQRVAFKVKTTSPKLYSVRPNSGVLLPRETKDVVVMLQASKDDIPPDAKSKDKFLIQSIELTDAEAVLPLTELWQQVETTKKEQIREAKLKCTYLPPLTSTQTIAQDDLARGIDMEQPALVYLSPPLRGDRGLAQRATASSPLTSAGPRHAASPNTVEYTKHAKKPSASAGGSSAGVPPALVVLLVIVSLVLGFQLAHLVF